MSFPNPDSIRGTIQSLKEIVITLKGEDHEASRLIHQMEQLVLEIEHKIKHLAKTPASGQGTAINVQTNPAASPAQATT